MKKILYLAAVILAGASMTSCQDDYENVGSESNCVFGSSLESVVNAVLDGKADEITRNLAVTVASPVSHDVIATYGVDESYVKVYNDLYGANAIMLPEGHYSLENPEVTIPANQTSSNTATLKFTNLLALDPQNLYVLPVRITHANISILDSRATTYYVFRGAALINVVGGMKGTCLTFVNEGQTPLLGGIEKFTFEALIYPEAFDNQLSTLMGIEGKCLIRVGDAGIPSNQLQFAKGRNATDAAWQFEIGKWTFLTLTFDASTGAVEVYFDGVKKGNTQYANSGAVNWNVRSSDRACYIGYAYDTNRDFVGRISEVRVWNKILTPAEINARNHFYRVENDAEGLVGYWKFDEGQGSLVHDYANGYDMQVPATYPGKDAAPGPLGWYEVTLP